MRMTDRLASTSLENIQAQLMEETANSLGIAGKRLETSLALLAAAPPGAPQRDELLYDAVDATYAYVVHRDILRLDLSAADRARVLDTYQVPEEVRLRLGVKRPDR